MKKNFFMTSVSASEVEASANYKNCILICLEFIISHSKSLTDEMKEDLIDQFEEQMTVLNSFEISPKEETIFYINENLRAIMKESTFEKDNPILIQAESASDALRNLFEYQNSSGIAADIFSVIRKGICYGTTKNDYFLRCIWGLAKCKHNWKYDEAFSSFLAKFVFKIMDLEQGTTDFT